MKEPSPFVGTGILFFPSIDFEIGGVGTIGAIETVVESGFTFRGLSFLFPARRIF